MLSTEQASRLLPVSLLLTVEQEVPLEDAPPLLECSVDLSSLDQPALSVGRTVGGAVTDQSLLIDFHF